MDTESAKDPHQSSTTNSKEPPHLQRPKKIGRADFLIAAAAASCRDQALCDTSQPELGAADEANNPYDNRHSTLDRIHNTPALFAQADALGWLDAEIPVPEQPRVTIEFSSTRSRGKRVQLAHLADISTPKKFEHPSPEKILNENGKRTASEALSNYDTYSKKAKPNGATRTDDSHNQSIDKPLWSQVNEVPLKLLKANTIKTNH